MGVEKKRIIDTHMTSTLINRFQKELSMITYFKAIMIGLVLWAIINLSLFTKIVEFAIKRNSVLYIHLLKFCTFLGP